MSILRYLFPFPAAPMGGQPSFRGEGNGNSTIRRVDMGRVMGTLCLAAATAGAQQDKISWDKPEAALRNAQMTGKPIVWYFTCNEFTKDAGMTLPTTIGTADLAFQDASVLKRKDKFFWVRGDQTLAT